MIHKLKLHKTAKAKSNPEVIGILTDALMEARQNKIVSVTVTMVKKEATYTTYAITTQGTFSETIGTIALLKDKIMDRWREP